MTIMVSTCCRDSVSVLGDTTQHWVCRNCGKPCDALPVEVIAEVLEGLRAAERGETVDLGDFSQYADDEDASVMTTWEDRMAARTRARGRHHEQVRNRERQAEDDEHERVHGTHHRHLEGAGIFCSCGEFQGAICVAYPAEWAAMTREQISAAIDALSCDVCGKRGLIRLGG